MQYCEYDTDLILLNHVQVKNRKTNKTFIILTEVDHISLWLS